MSTKNSNELDNTSKILNSDIYDITSFVDDIKKRNIDGVGSRDENGNIINDGKETLSVGMYGYMGYQFSSLLQNAIVVASELSNEANPTRAKFDRNVITHALSLGVEKVAATPANMKILMMFPEKALRANMINDKFTFYADTKLNFGEYEYHTDYDIEIFYNNLTDSNNGSDRHYIYSARYIMNHKNPISDIDNPYLPPIAIYTYVKDNFVVLATNIHQVYYKEIEEKIVGTDEIANKTISFSFDNQMSHFFVNVEETINGTTTTTKLIPVYDGLYSQEQANNKYCYYQYINSNTIRIRFDPSSYQPRTNANVKIQLYTTSGSAANFEYTEDNTIRLVSDKYTNLYTIISQRGEDGSSGGLDRQTIEELQRIIPKEALSRGSITTLTDLKNFFNSLNNETSVLHTFREEDNILNRIYYTYNLMKDRDLNVVPTNTIPVYLESYKVSTNNKLYIESGTPIFYYKYGDGAGIDILRDNYVGYMNQKISNVKTEYSVFNDKDGYTMYQGTPTLDTLNIWYNHLGINGEPDARYSLDPENYITMNYEQGKTTPPLYYDFHDNANIQFKIKYHSTSYPEDSSLYNGLFYGTIRSDSNTSLVKYSSKKLSDIYISFIHPYSTVNSNGTVVNNSNTKRSLIEITLFKDGKEYHIPKRDSDTYELTGFSTILLDEYSKYVTSINYFRKNESNISFGDKCEYSAEVIKDNDGNLVEVNIYAFTIGIDFYDNGRKFAITAGSLPDSSFRRFIIPGYIQDIRDLTDSQKNDYIDTLMTIFNSVLNNKNNNTLVLESVNTIDCYAYDGQGEFSFDNLNLTEGDIIRFTTYNENVGKYAYENPETWELGEVLSINRNNGKILSIEVLTKNTDLGEFVNNRYSIPIPDSGLEMNENYITHISKVTKFVYTSPLSIVLKDDPAVSSHRITASYYLDIINETRYQDFKCINSKSPIQFILSSIHTYRSSYLSNNRYTYNISFEITPNTGRIDKNMINRTQVIGVLYKNGIPSIYSIANYTGPTNYDSISLNAIPYEINLYTKPFETDDEQMIVDGVIKNVSIDIVDQNNCVYTGPKRLIKDLKNNSILPEQEFFDRYHVYYTTGRNDDWARPLIKPDDLNLDKLPKYYAQSVYLDLNTELKIYILYKYDTNDISKYYDDTARMYMATNSSNVNALRNSVPDNTMFTEVIKSEDDDPLKVYDYALSDMVLTNVYDTSDGINLLYDYSNIMNSYVGMIRNIDLFDSSKGTIESYIVNRIPCIRYFYWWNEDKVLSFIKEIKKKINYVLDAIDPLECTFGLDFKFFNTYGPSNMYHVTEEDGDIGELIDNVALTMSFRTKFYNDSDRDDICIRIKDRIKSYLEKLDSLDDIHFPNITTDIEREFGQYIVYFEFISFNIYDANHQHIITDENMEMLTSVPEFLHVDTNDYNTFPYINIKVVN